LTRAAILFKLASMKIYILAAVLLALAACDSAPTQNAVVQDVAANNMIADEVTEVQDDSAAAPTESSVPAPGPMSDQERNDEAAAKKDRGEE
jgi:hypothetical protein